MAIAIPSMAVAIDLFAFNRTRPSTLLTPAQKSVVLREEEVRDPPPVIWKIAWYVTTIPATHEGNVVQVSATRGA